LAPAQKFEFGFQSASAEAHDLQPFFDYSQNAKIKCCSEDNAASPNTFPQAAQFASNGKGDSATGSPEEISQDEGAYAGFVSGGAAGVWPTVGCANELQNCDGTPQQNPDPGLKVPEPGSLLLILSGLSAVLVFLFAKR
jgi:hypothetical protein